MTADIQWNWHVSAHPIPTLRIEARHERADGVKYAIYTECYNHAGDIELACQRLRQCIEGAAEMNTQCLPCMPIEEKI